MTFQEKLKRLIGTEDQATVAKRAGISATAISNYLRRDDSMPRSKSALGLARAFGCSLEWLVDDNKTWEEKDTGSAANISDAELSRELAERYLATASALKDDLYRAASIDWTPIARALASLPINAQIPAEIAPQFNLFFSIMRRHSSLAGFDIMGRFYLFASIGKDARWQASELTAESLYSEFDRRKNDVPGLAAIYEATVLRMMANSELKFPPESIESQKQTVANEIAKLDRSASSSLDILIGPR
jgi:transcriptional regulator with XRE-family HTH domain